MMRVHTSIGTKDVAAARGRVLAGLKSIDFGRVRLPDGLHVFLSPGTGGGGSLTISATPPTASGAVATNLTATATTNTVTASVTGGYGTLTYSWELYTSDGSSWAIESPVAATTRFSASGLSPGDLFTATFRCTVTDQAGRTGLVDVDATAYNYGDLNVYF